MVIITDKIGQLCNRLFHFSYFIANSVEYDYKVMYPYFDDYKFFFESTATNKFEGHPISIKLTPFKLISKLILKYINTLVLAYPNKSVLNIRANNEIYDLKNEQYINKAKTGIVLTKGWLFKDEKNLKKHRELLLQIFKPVASYAEIVNQLFVQLKANFDYIIGIHIRRGDYREWNDGKYFYPDEVYLANMETIEREVAAQGKSCCFFICSNEAVNKDIFAHLNTNIEQRHFIVDLYSLAECDYIIGPPSTFGYWASFYGNKPLYFIENANENISLNAFLYY